MTWWLSVRDAGRWWTRRPAFAASVVSILAIGIAATTAIFSLIDAVLLRPYPWPGPHRLVRVHAVLPDRRFTPAGIDTWTRAPVSWAAWKDLQSSRVFDGVGAWYSARQVYYDATPTIVEVTYASSSLFHVLGASPAVGRLFTAAEDEDVSDLVILPHATWQRRFGGRADVLDQTVAIGATPESPGARYRVIGVLPPTFQFVGESPEFVLALGRMAWNGSFDTNRFLRVVGRLAEGITPEAALAATEPMVRRLENPSQRTARVVSVVEDQVGHLANQLWLLLGAAILLLLVAASNVGGLLLNDVRLRRHEIAVRTALGADRAQVLRQLGCEYLIAGIAAGLAGVLLARATLPVLLALAPSGLAAVDAPGIHTGVMALAVGLGLLTTVVFGSAPALLLSSVNSPTMLSGGGRSSTRTGLNGHRLIVAAALGLTLVMVVSASLLTETIRRLGARPLGFDPDGVAIVHVQLAQYPTMTALSNPAPGASIESIRGEYERVRMSGWLHSASLIDRLTALPGSTGAAAVGAAPFTGTANQMRILPVGALPSEERLVQRHNVTEGYFGVMKIPVLRGRGFVTDDRSPRAAIVSRELDRSLFGQRAVGSTFTAAGITYTIVGVVENVKHHDLADDDAAAVYVLNRTVTDVNYFLVRTAGDPAAALPALRQAVQDHDPFARVISSRPMTDLVAGSIAEERFRGWVSGLFGATALMLAGIGLYGLAARFVSERRREIGIRMALGAQPFDVRLFVLRDAALITLVGAGLGLPVAYGAARLAGAFLYGVSASDPTVFVLSTAVLVAAAIVACVIPARRATAIDPVIALRE